MFVRKRQFDELGAEVKANWREASSSYQSLAHTIKDIMADQELLLRHLGLTRVITLPQPERTVLKYRVRTAACAAHTKIKEAGGR